MGRDLVLIVHEARSEQHRLTLVLEGAEYDTLTATTARAALGLFGRTAKQLAAVGVDGVELAMKMKTLDDSGPVVLMSDTIIDQVERRYDAFLQIPFRDSALISTIEFCGQPQRTHPIPAGVPANRAHIGKSMSGSTRSRSRHSGAGSPEERA